MLRTTLSLASKHIGAWFIAAVVSVGMAACGGGGGGGGGVSTGDGDTGGGSGGGETSAGTTVPLRFDGVAARGAPIANASVDIHCLAGTSSAGVSATTDMAGRYQITVNNGALPCVARVTDNAGITLHSATDAEGTFNITPLTELMTASVAFEPPASFFNNYNLTRANRISSDSLRQAQQNVRAELADVTIDPSLDFVKTPFAANGADRMDVILEELADKVDQPRFDQIRNKLSGVSGSDTQPPSVTLSVDRQSITTPGAVTITAEASDESGIDKVEFIENGIVVETVRQAPFTARRSYSLTDNGSKNILVKAYDKSGNVATSSAVIIIVNITVAPPADTTAPGATLDVPRQTVTSAGDFVVTADATDNVGVTKVEFYWGDTLVHTDSTAPYEFRDQLTTADNGTIVYTVKAYDLAGNVATSEAVTVAVNIAAPAWTIVDLGTLGGGFSKPTGINDAGEVVGFSTIDSGNTISHAFLYKNRQMKDLDTPDSPHSYAAAINNLGQIVGVRVSNGSRGAFLYQDGKMAGVGEPGITPTDMNDSGDIVGLMSGSAVERIPTADGDPCSVCAFLLRNGVTTNLGDFNPDASDFASASGINSAGQITGVRGTKFALRTFLVQNGTATNIGVLNERGPDPTGTIASDINNDGQIVGRSNGSGFSYSNGIMTDLEAGTNSDLSPDAVNDRGQIVGNVRAADGTDLGAFLHENGSLTRLNDLPEIKAADWVLKTATAINNSGQIVGTGTNEKGQNRAYLLTPPQPQ